MYWFETTIEQLRDGQIDDLTELQELAAEWARRRRHYRYFRSDTEWADVVILEPLERPRPGW
ncbi:hypothetical protein ACL02T_31265 [Pseudonocardia sp. RS010]|uniref:hypothetical protein n=1 Tax=Pseudonocardia sp. RS010 TaxID=3385979 RepID=UPI0039A063B6